MSKKNMSSDAKRPVPWLPLIAALAGCVVLVAGFAQGVPMFWTVAAASGCVMGLLHLATAFKVGERR